MKQNHSHSCSPTHAVNVHLKIDDFLEMFPTGACIIGPDFKIRQINNELAELTGAKVGTTCYEALAGASDMCPFCQFFDVASGVITNLPAMFHVRRGKASLVNLKHMPESGNPGLILETIQPVRNDRRLTEEECARSMLPMLLQKLTGLLIISRGLMGNLTLNEKIDHVIDTIKNVLDYPDVESWIELDNKTYGSVVEKSEEGLVHTELIKVDGKVRGKLYVYLSPGRSLAPEEVYFLEEAGELIDRQLEIDNLWGMVRQSEERYKKLAGNLSKEMWSRTEALVQERAYLEGILRSSEDMIITTDLDSRIVSFNPGAEKMLDHSAEEVQGLKIAELWVNSEEREKLMNQVMLTGGIRNYQTALRTKAGDLKEISLSLSLLKDAEGRILGTVGVSKDIGKENAIRRELERLNQNYREAIHFINHEAKNSLVVMGGFLRRLLQNETDTVRRDQLKIVYHHSKFLESMSRDFLIMAELEHGEFQFRKKLIKNCYKEVILPAMMGLKERYPDSFQTYDSSMGGVGAIQLVGDPALLEVVYRNLFGNALKYRSPNGKIAYGVKDHGDRYLFNVWNEGPGVPLDEKEKIFEKFYRVHNEYTKDKRGTGLGLFNIRRIIETHGGRIWCETDPDHWIDFLFELPKESD